MSSKLSRFYTSAHLVKDEILVRGYDASGRRFEDRIEYRPYLFLPSAGGDFVTVYGDRCRKKNFDSVSAAEQFVEMYSDADGDFYGQTNWLYVYLNDDFPGVLTPNYSLIQADTIDIETDSEGGYADLETADKPIWTITVRRRGIAHVFGMKDYVSTSPDVVYNKYRDEEAMLQGFLKWWESDYPDVITGWNTKTYDIVYLFRRISNQLSTRDAKRLSPWGIVRERKIRTAFSDDEETTFEVFGIPNLDYLPIYRKFSYKNHPDYRLDTIVAEELKEKKHDYSDVGDLADLYRQDFKRFVDYNVQDTVLIDRLEAKVGLLKLIYTFALDAKVLFPDTVTTVLLWDVVIHNYLLEQGIVIPQRKGGEKREFAGGYVKPTMIGKHGWVVSFDLTSLYPHLIMQYNISPETLIGKLEDDLSVNDVLDGKLKDLDYDFRERNQAIAANLALFDREKHGFLAQLMQKYFDDRAAYKKKMNAAKAELEADPDNQEIQARVSTYNNLQEVRKRLLNGAYGALGNAGFRWFQVINAEAITKSGQLSIQWVDRYINALMNRLCGTKNAEYILAADTDSIYVLMDPLVRKHGLQDRDPKEVAALLDRICEDRLRPEIDRAFNDLAEYMNSREQKMHMKREFIARSAMWTGKKHYILDVYHKENVVKAKPEIVVKGMAVVKSSTPKICRDAMEEVCKIVMRGTERELQDFVAGFRKDFFSKGFAEISAPGGVSFKRNVMVGGVQTQITANLQTKGIGPMVRGAIHYNDMIVRAGIADRYPPIHGGGKARMCYMRMPNPFMDKAIAVPYVLPPELGLEKYIDHEEQFRVTFLKPLEKVFAAAGWSPERKPDLDGFLGDLEDPPPMEKKRWFKSTSSGSSLDSFLD